MKDKNILSNPEDLKIERSDIKPGDSYPSKRAEKARKAKKAAEAESAPKAPEKMDYKQMMKAMRNKFRGFTEEHFDDFVDCWNNIKDSQKKASMYLDACKLIMPAQSIVDLDVGVKEEDSFATKLMVLRDSVIKKGE